MLVHPHSKIGPVPADTQANLRILATTDLHLAVLPYDYFSDRPAPDTGLGQAASLVRALRAGADNCLLFDNGDFLQGNPLADWVARASGFKPGDLHPMIAAMNTLGYDAGTLGNHEFDYGLAFLTDSLAQANFAVTSANVLVHKGDGSDADQPLLPPFVLLDRQMTCTDGQIHTFRVGVIGFAPPLLVDWNRIILQGQIGAAGIVAAAQHYVPLMRQAGADIIVALSHSGIGQDAADPNQTGDLENVSVELAAIDGIDVIITGHTHKVFPGPDTPRSLNIDPVAGTLHGKPAVMAGSHGSHVGVIDLLLHRQDGHWAVTGHHSRAEPVNRPHPAQRWPVDEQVQAAATASHDVILSLIRRPIGASDVSLHSYFALSAPDLTIQVMAEAQSAHAAEILHQTRWAGLPVLSAVAPSKAGGLSGALNYVDISPGILQVRHAAELSVFPNSFCILALTGADLRDWLEQSAGIFARVTPGQTDQPLLNPDFPCYNFDVIDGVTYEIDPSQPSRTDGYGRLVNPGSGRIKNLRHHGQLVGPTQPFVMATNSYRVGGGGGFSMAERAQIIHHSAENTRDILIRHLRHANPLTGSPRRIWQFTALPGTAAWFDSAADGLPHLATVTGQNITRHVKTAKVIPNTCPRSGQIQRFCVNF